MNDPGPALNFSSPHCTSNSPSSTQNDSSSPLWMCNGGECPGPSRISTSPKSPPVCSVLALISIRLFLNQCAGPSSAPYTNGFIDSDPSLISNLLGPELTP